MAKKLDERRGMVTKEAHTEAVEEKLLQEELITEAQKDEAEEIRETLKETFDFYPEIKFLWVVKDDNSILSAFLPKDISSAETHARSVKKEIVKITR